MKKKLDFKVISFDSYGHITVSINGKVYHYNIQGYQINRVIDLSKYRQGKALNYLKKCNRSLIK